MLTITDVSRALDVHPDTLRRLEQAGAFVAQRTRAGARRYTPEDVEMLRRILYPARTPASLSAETNQVA
jgi:DNA-binding transcriptional MerR regulator